MATYTIKDRRNLDPEKALTDAAVAVLADEATAAERASFQSQSGGIPISAENPLTLPMYSGRSAGYEESVTHVGVRRFEEAWNGYAYWMAYTPWPIATEELTHIAASNDGINWEEPSGFSNPLTTVAEIGAAVPGGLYTPDPDLVLLPDGRMMCVFVVGPSNPSPGDVGIWCKISSDGVNWGEMTELIAVDHVSPGRLSPSIDREDDGTYSLWATDKSTQTIHHWTSPDALTWTYDQECSIARTEDYTPDHSQVRIVNGEYHLLLHTLNDTGDKLRYYVSADGVTFTGGEPLPKSGEYWDAYNTYRSALVPNPGNPISWDVYVSGIPLDAYTVAGGADSEPWRIGLLRGVTFGRTALKSAVTGDDLLNERLSTDELRFGDNDWVTSTSGSGLALHSDNHGLYIATGTTANSDAVAKTGAYGQGQWAANPVGLYYVNTDFSNPMKLATRFWTNSLAGDAVLRCHFGGHAASATTAGDMDRKGFGFEIHGTQLKLVMHDGSSLTAENIMTHAITFNTEVIVQNLGDGYSKIWVNGTDYGAFSGGPTGTSADFKVWLMIDGGATDTTNYRASFYKLILQGAAAYDSTHP